MVRIRLLNGATGIMSADEAREQFHKGMLDWDLDNACYRQAKPRKPRPKGLTYNIRRTRA